MTTETKKTLLETDFNKFLEQATESDLEKYEETLTDGREIDFTTQCWGHAFNPDKKVGNFGHYGCGFYGAVLGSKKVTAGDICLLKTANGIGKFLVLNVRYENDPRDMFWAYVVCVGYKE